MAHRGIDRLIARRTVSPYRNRLPETVDEAPRIVIKSCRYVQRRAKKDLCQPRRRFDKAA
jgi:hypothetical protein